jgi:hypothetical protein
MLLVLLPLGKNKVRSKRNRSPFTEANKANEGEEKIAQQGLKGSKDRK